MLMKQVDVYVINITTLKLQNRVRNTPGLSSQPNISKDITSVVDDRTVRWRVCFACARTQLT